ncbi:MAG: hypothetical protein WBW92_11460 [Rhodanobacteraceae bacterium]
MKISSLYPLLMACLVGGVATPNKAGAFQSAPASNQSAPTASPTPAARLEDVKSMPAIMHAVYDVISGPKGQKRDWDRMRSLFVPGARLIPVQTDKDGNTRTRMLSVEDYIRLGGPYLEKEGFFERETHREVDRYGAIAQVFSTYESRHGADDAKPFARGINSFQLFYDGKRWWVVTIYWQEEKPGLPIPKTYGGRS